MPYAVELYLDNESAEKVDKIRNKLATEGISIDKGAKPHISLAIFEDIEIESFVRELQMFARKIKTLNVTLSSIGMFVTENPVIYIAPTVTKELLTVHSKFQDDFEKYKNEVWDYYLTNKWVPHCTLAMNLNSIEVNKTIEICSKIRLPMKVKLDSIGLLEFKPNKQLIEYKIE